MKKHVTLLDLEILMLMNGKCFTSFVIKVFHIILPVQKVMLKLKILPNERERERERERESY